MPMDPRDVQALRRLGRNLRARRRELDESQDSVALRAGLSNQSVLSKLEVGDRESSVLKYLRVAASLEMQPDEILDGVLDLYR